MEINRNQDVETKCLRMLLDETERKIQIKK